jgi:putative peptidoglycan lipid II flippase
MWNASMIAALVIFGGQATLPRLAVILAWGSVAGSALQCAVQFPLVMRVAPDLRLSLDVVARGLRTNGDMRTPVREIVRNFVPVFVSRGVVQISAYVDTLLASLLPTGAVAGLMNAQLLYTLPISLFGMSVSAAELPTLSAVTATAGISGTVWADPAAADVLRRRLDAGLRQIAFFVVPSGLAFIALGDVIAAAVFETGRFGRADTLLVWAILASSAIGLLPSTLGRLYSSAYFALRDTRTPLNYALARVSLGIVAGYFFAIPLPRMLGIPGLWGAAGLAVSAGLAGWVEMLLLRRALNQRIGSTGVPGEYLAKLWGSATAAGAMAWTLKLTLPVWHPAVVAAIVLGAYGVGYLSLTLAFRVPEASAALNRVIRKH